MHNELPSGSSLTSCGGWLPQRMNQPDKSTLEVEGEGLVERLILIEHLCNGLRGRGDVMKKEQYGEKASDARQCAGCERVFLPCRANLFTFSSKLSEGITV